MRLPFRRKDKKKSESSSSYPEEFRPWPPATTFHAPPTYRSAQLLDQFSHVLLQRIFAFVCPHTRDESYDPCEESAGDDGCMLCDLRDLSHCAQVNRTWRASAVTILYVSPDDGRSPGVADPAPDITASASTRCITASWRRFWRRSARRRHGLIAMASPRTLRLPA